MYKFSTKLKLNRETIMAANLVDRFSVEDLGTIGSCMREQYERDCRSRELWEQRTEAAMDLAMQVQQDKTWPWPGCSNIVFPLVTIAAMQFHARAYPAVVNGRNVVGCRVLGDDPEGVEQARADRVSKFMSYQLLEEDSCWEEELDRSLLSTAIVGCDFVKTHRTNGRNTSEVVMARDLVMDYYAKSVDRCGFKTHVYEWYRNDMHERIAAGLIRDVSDFGWYNSDAVARNTVADVRADKRTGLEQPSPDMTTPFTILEHHCWMDFDQDGYAEPYIITTEWGSGDVIRIVTRFDREEDIVRNDKGGIVKINPTEYFTKRPFIPSPDGSIYDIGFGVLLGPLNESVNSAINQLFDAGTLANTAGGFLGRGAKIRGGVVEFRPFGWNRVDSSGDDLRKNIMPLPVREPNAVMFQLLSLIIDYTNRISGATDMLTGQNPGQNTPAQTSQAMIEQGQMIYSAIYKRLWRSLKWEFKKLYNLNALYLPVSLRYGDAGGNIAREDFSGSVNAIVPSADPTITSDAAMFARAQILKQAASGNPGYNADVVEREFLRALGIPDSKLIYPGLEAMGPPGPSEKVQIQQMKNEIAAQQLQLRQQEIMLNLQETQRLNNANIAKLEAQAASIQKDSQLAESDMRIQAFRAAIEALREQNKNADAQFNQLMELGRDVTQSIGTGPTGI